MPKIKFINEDKEVEVEPGENLRQAAIANGLAIHHEPAAEVSCRLALGSAEIVGIQVSEGVADWPRKAIQVLNCHGLGLCGTCRVHVKAGMENCSPPGKREKFKLALSSCTIGHEDEVRLACQTQVNGDIEVETHPRMNLFGERYW